ncbi:L-ribulose-5-phosphate 4-epimerase AraD [Pelagicoccus sp. SDUM812002]|uniref:L-ribulose-5-phosphate 4-epimerase AraD n=1 Tax=Pelagicoccus sp. SDUM812002 TaxID=3041266 RepID=UPI00280DF332|nr:L-ribulose-5-phosphate 4-epimerase AraD [Pelagicoccus sp. SDUM812002]MDQ8185560.1 L-ribulose-5-phosphate 4-epimerase AraD [Pelagicoccus sp. SDUM812002]
MNYEDIREECVAANKELQSLGLIDITFGNVSVLDPTVGVFAIKPSGVPYDALTPEQMVIVDLEGKTVEGDLRPSSDEPTHRRLFIELGDKGITSVVHTHSRNAVGFAQAERSIPCLGTTHCDYFRGAVPVTRAMTVEEVEGAYEWETGNVIVELFSEVNPLEITAALVRNHGPFVWGKNGAKAVETAFALEIVADMAAKTLALNPSAAGAPAHLLKKHYDRKHGPGAYYGQK